MVETPIDFTAFLIDPEHSKPMGIGDVCDWSPSDGALWVHLDRTSEESQAWMTDQAGLEPHVVRGLLASGSRPRIEVINDGLFLILRGVNLNEGADPADMISLRIWVEQNRLISLEREKLQSIAIIAEQARNGEGPVTIGSLVIKIIDGLAARVAPVIDQINDRLDELEDMVIGPEVFDDRTELLTMRQQVVKLHRYLKPQVEVLNELRKLKPAMIGAHHQQLLAEIINKNTRYVEDLESSKNRMALIQEELTNQYAERLNNRLYAVTMIATILLPMTLFTGLLGINVGGIPGVHAPYAFVVVCGVLVLMGLIGYWIVRRCKWL